MKLEYKEIESQERERLDIAHNKIQNDISMIKQFTQGFLQFHQGF